MMQVWKVRLTKFYEGAVNRIFVGELRESTETYVKLRCAEFDFKVVANGLRDVGVGEIIERIIPWFQIECVDILPAGFEIEKAQLIAGENKNLDAILTDGSYSVDIIKRKKGRVPSDLKKMT